MGAIDDLRELLERAGISEDDIRSFLDQLGGDSIDAEDIAAKLGKILGKFASGAASGSGIPLDSDLFKLLLDILGPVTAGLLDDLLKKILGSGPGYDVSSPGPSPYKRQRILKDPRDTFDIIDTLAPDIYLLGTPQVGCVGGDMISIKAKVKVEHREENIKLFQAIALGAAGGQAGSDLTWNGSGALPEADAQEKGQTYDVDVEIAVRCADAVQNAGIVVLQIVAEDVDGNQMIDLVTVNLLAELLNNSEECCKTFKTDEIRKLLLEGALGGLKKLNKEDLEDLLDSLAPDDDESSSRLTPPKAEEPSERREVAGGQVAPRLVEAEQAARAYDAARSRLREKVERLGFEMKERSAPQANRQ